MDIEVTHCYLNPLSFALNPLFLEFGNFFIKESGSFFFYF
jgi:hypothetical protein